MIYVVIFANVNDLPKKTVIFFYFFLALEANAPAWYQALTEGLNSDQQKAMQEISTLADQRRAAAQSKKIQQSGGMCMQGLLLGC